VSVSGLRGVIGDGLDPVVATEFAAAYAAECPPGWIMVGHDGRRSASILRKAVVAGLAAAGRDVNLPNAGPTPPLGALIAEFGAAGGVQITASHNPAEYNGLKFFQPGGMVLSPAQGRAVLERFERREFRWAAWDRLGRIDEYEHVNPSHHIELI